MPYVNDPCPQCEEGFIQECNPPSPPSSFGLGDPGCVTCSECDFHDTASPVPSYAPQVEVPLPAEEPVDPWDWQALTLPTGFRWHRYPEFGVGYIASIGADRPEYPEELAGLRAWAAENELVVDPYRVQAFHLGSGYARLPYRFSIRQTADPHNPAPIAWNEEFVCPLCSATHPAYTINCENSASFLRCAACLFFRSDLKNANPDDPFSQYLCADCRHECADENCEVEVYDTQFCEDHGQTANCEQCDYWIELHVEEDFLRDGNNRVVCDDCHSRCCGECGNYQRRSLEWSEEHSTYLCRRCLLGGDDAEEFDENDSAELHIPAIPGRENIRLCGVEIEGGDGSGNGQSLAAAFHNAGLSEWDRMGGYHSGSEGGFAHVERDSSVDWEAVIGPVNFAEPTDVEALDEAVKSIRSLVRDGTLTLDLRAGCHIHVEAARTSLDGAYNLNLLFAYAEDVIFRLAAARWPIHRAVQDTHYTQPIPKELRKVQFAQHHAEGGEARYYALSFSNYFNQMLGRCRCGATRYDSWEECTCNLGKCTFEFRVFNTTANPRKLHAYLALSQALVAKALSMERIEATDYPALSFVARRFKDMDGSAQEELVASWQERLTWLFNELPLTNDEKASLAYCVRHSELEAVGEEFIGTLLPEQQVITEVTA